MANQNSTLTQEYIRSLFYYKDGNLHWAKPMTKNKIKKDCIAGYKSKRYVIIGIKNKHYQAHRIIWLYHYGYLPNEIDHIDGNMHNNKIKNLREVSHNQNQYNHKLNKRNTSGVKGISFDKNRISWVVRFNVNKKPIYFGRFDNLELAELVAIEARDKYHGEFARS